MYMFPNVERISSAKSFSLGNLPLLIFPEFPEVLYSL